MEFFSIKNISNFTILDCFINNNTFIDSSLISSENSNVYLKGFNFSQNNFLQTENLNMFFMKISNYIVISNFTFFNNSFNTPIIGNEFFINYLHMEYINFTQNAVSDFSIAISIFFFKNGENIEFQSFHLENNVITNSLISITSFVSFIVNKLEIIENTSQNAILITNCIHFLSDIFICSKNNINLYYYDIIEIGSCLTIYEASYISINSSQVTECIGLYNIPGLIISNTLISSIISINNSIFTNNMYNSTQTIGSYGCALSISSYPLISLNNSYFKENYIILQNEDSGGPALYYSSSQNSSFIIDSSVFLNNFSLKKSVVLHFIGFILSILNSQFLSNSHYNSDFETEMFLYGTAKYLLVNNCNIIDSTASDGLYFLYERITLIITFNFVNIIGNSAYLTAGFNSQFETKNREILFINSIFSNNTISDGGGTFLYFYLYSPIVKFNFTVYNTIISDNYADPGSYGIIVFWTYSNNNTFALINSQMNGNMYPSYMHQRCFISFFGIKELTSNSVYILIRNSSITNSTSGNIFILYFQCTAILENALIQGTDHIGTEQLIQTKQSNMEMQNVSFINNNIVSSLLYFFGPCNILINNTNFLSNYINYYFLLALDNLNVQIFNTNVVDNTFQENFDFFCKFQNIENSVFYNNSFMNNHGHFSSMFVKVNCYTEFSNNLIGNEKNNDSSFIALFRFYSSDISLINFELTFDKSKFISNLIILQSSNLVLTNISLQLSQIANDFTLINLLKSQIQCKNSSFLNIFMTASNYVFNSFQSNVSVDSVSIKNCQNFFDFRSSSLNLTNSLLMDITTSSNIDYIMIFQKSYQIFINSNVFQNFLSNQSSIFIINSIFSSNISNNSFINLTVLSSSGGGCFIKNSKIFIISNLFFKNQAIRGGALYFECLFEDNDLCNFYLKDNNFVMNSALIDGGAYKFEYIEPYQTNNTFINNSAIYGIDYSSFFFRLGLRITYGNQTIFSSFDKNNSELEILTNIPSNYDIKDYLINLYPLDTFNQIILEQISQKVNIEVLQNINFNNSKLKKVLSEYLITDDFYCKENSTNIEYVGKLSALQESDLSFLFTNFRIIACPTSLIYLKFTTVFPSKSALTYYFKKNSLNEVIGNDYFIFLPIKVARCKIGEFFDPDMVFCQECNEGYYSILSETYVCQPCKTNAICEGGDELLLEAHFWNDPDHLENIYGCSAFADNCLGGLNSNCSDGYEGILCENCIRIINDQIHYKNALDQCIECPNVYMILLAYFFIILAFWYCFRKIFTVFDREKEKENDSNKKFALKIFINFTHFLIYTKNQYDDLEYISYDMQNLLKHVKFFFKFEYVYASFDCLFYLSNHDNAENPYIDEVFIICMFYLICICYYLYLRHKKTPFKKIINRLFLISYIMMPYLFNFLKEAVTFRTVNNISLLRTNTNFTFYDLYAEFFIFIVPNLLFFAGMLFFHNIYLNSKYKSFRFRDIQPHQISLIGLKNIILYEGFNYLTMIFFFIITSLDI